MKILFVSLGCDKNLVDSESMLALLRGAGYDITDDESEADIAVVNTCCFIHDAKEESIRTILELAKRKEEGTLKALIVAGCLSQRFHEEFKDELPEVDGMLGTANIDDIVALVDKVMADKIQGASLQEEMIGDLTYLPKDLTDRVITTYAGSSYLKIAEGCNKRCTYCIIPYLRGNYRSIPMEEIIATAEKLVEAGCVELTLVAQETTLYGVDLYGEKTLPKLLRKLAEIENLRWIRLLYTYPEEITEELIEEMATNPKVCHYLDMPIQHSEDRILKAMGRRTDQAKIREVIGKLRAAMPDITLRTTLITGFPGETEEEHQALLSFIDEMEFERLGAFPYSPEEGTKAAEMDGQIPEEVKQARYDEIMSLQQEISMDLNAAMVGETFTVLVEGYLREEDVYVGRSYREAPSVDGYIFISSPRELISGMMVTVKITEANAYDLIGEVEDESGE